jgi:hypothetical protein
MKMKKYTNTSRRLVCLQFRDAEAVYLRRGKAVETDLEPVDVPAEIHVEVVKRIVKSNKTEGDNQ